MRVKLKVYDPMMIGRYVVVESYESGVHVGVLKESTAGMALLDDERTLKGWVHTPAAVSKVAKNGETWGYKISKECQNVPVYEVYKIMACTVYAEDRLRKQR